MSDYLPSNLQSIRGRWSECYEETKTYRDPWQAVNDIGELLREVSRLTARVAELEHGNRVLRDELNIADNMRETDLAERDRLRAVLDEQRK